jgi:hypothetical protein
MARQIVLVAGGSDLISRAKSLAKRERPSLLPVAPGVDGVGVGQASGGSICAASQAGPEAVRVKSGLFTAGPG